MSQSPYEILGVSPDASMDEVKKAYRKKARENHPDLNPGDKAAAERMNEINQAYDRIMNPEKYAKQDARRNAYGYGTPYTQDYPGPGSTGGSSAGSGTGNPWSDYGPPGSGGTGRPNGTGYGDPYRDPYGRPFAGGSDDRGYEWYEFSWEDIFGGARPGDAGPIHPEASAMDSAEVRAAITAMNAGDYPRAVGILSAITSKGRDARWYYLSALANDGAGNTMMAQEQIRRALQMDPGNADYVRAQRSFTRQARQYEEESAEQGFSTGFINPNLIWCCVCLPWMCNPLIGVPIPCIIG